MSLTAKIKTSEPRQTLSIRRQSPVIACVGVYAFLFLLLMIVGVGKKCFELKYYFLNLEIVFKIFLINIILRIFIKNIILIQNLKKKKALFR